MRVNLVIFGGRDTLLLQLNTFYPPINEAVAFSLHGHRRIPLLPWIMLLLAYLVNNYDIFMCFVILIAVLVFPSVTVVFIDLNVFFLVLIFLIFIPWLFVIIMASVDRASSMRDDWNLEIHKRLAWGILISEPLHPRLIGWDLALTIHGRVGMRGVFRHEGWFLSIKHLKAFHILLLLYLQHLHLEL